MKLLRLLWRMRALRAKLRARGSLLIERSVRIDRGVRIEVEHAGRLAIGPGSHLEGRSRIYVRSGEVELGAHVTVGESATITAVQRISIHDRVRLGPRATVIDFGPGAVDSDVPLRRQRVSSRPVLIGEGAQLGAGSVVRAGGELAAGSSLAAGALVGLEEGVASAPAPGAF